MLGGYRRDRREKVEGLTVAGLLMFGTGLAICDEQAKHEQNERRLSEEDEKQGKNERRLSEDLSEVLTASDYKKVEKIILYLEENKYITPQIVEELTGKLAPTVRRYLKILVGTGYVKVDGSTSNIRYMI